MSFRTYRVPLKVCLIVNMAANYGVGNRSVEKILIVIKRQ